MELLQVALRVVVDDALRGSKAAGAYWPGVSALPEGPLSPW